MTPLVLIDFSNYVFACWFPALAAQKADPKYDPHGVLKTNLKGKLSTLTRTLNDIGWQDYEVLFVEDRRSKRKYDLWPDYKAKRKPMDFDPRPEAKEFLLSEGYKGFCHSPDNEADDAIATLVSQNRDREILIASSDKDLWQLIDDSIHHPPVSVWQLTKDRFVTSEMIFEEFGAYQPSQIPVVKALWGDSGDNVPNVLPRMQKHFLPAVQDTADIDSFFGWFGNFGGNFKREHIEKLEKAEPQVRLNYKLVKLDPNCAIIKD